MSHAMSAARPGHSPVLDLARSGSSRRMAETFLTVVEHSGLTPVALVNAFGRLAIGPGRISFSDYVKLRLFDPSLPGDARLDTYVGQRRNRDLCVAANHRHDWMGMLTNKVASASYVSAAGLAARHLRATMAMIAKL